MTNELESVIPIKNVASRKESELVFGTSELNTSGALNDILLLHHELTFFFGLLLPLYLGETPYANITNQNLLGVLKAGYRMDQPKMCSDDM